MDQELGFTGLEDHASDSRWQRFRCRARRYFRRKLGDGDGWVEELVQEACARAWASHVRCQERRAPVRSSQAWLDGISWRVLMDHFRAGPRRRLCSSSSRDLDEIRLQVGPHVGPYVGSRERRTRTTVGGREVELVELLAVLDETVDRLPARWRTAVRGRMRGLSMREIAASQGLTVTTVKMRLFRGRARLRKAILDRLEEMDR